MTIKRHAIRPFLSWCCIQRSMALLLFGIVVPHPLTARRQQILSQVGSSIQGPFEEPLLSGPKRTISGVSELARALKPGITWSTTGLTNAPCAANFLELSPHLRTRITPPKPRDPALPLVIRTTY
ncbi:hypothetical protein EDB80DRAFT_412081 [Ilyonectria destructans]|nr:hypothetical protein EDB80DRAFT_412081 [Ilyonectria destructans]